MLFIHKMLILHREVIIRNESKVPTVKSNKT